MNEHTKDTSSIHGVEAFGGMAKDSFDAMSKAFSGWTRNATRVQAETIRFINERFNKDLQMLTRFGSCKKPEDFVGLQSELMSQLVTDYTQEGAQLMKLFTEIAADAGSAAKK